MKAILLIMSTVALMSCASTNGRQIYDDKSSNDKWQELSDSLKENGRFFMELGRNKVQPVEHLPSNYVTPTTTNCIVMGNYIQCRNN